ncbi:hypothetical protein QZH41_015095 [Actinostola sp. cb2023]|nr:hypothetical protein QZH41_015095 [Actinostola sp. cb2023]
MPTGGYFTASSIFAFVALGIIRGSFSVVIHFADESYRSPSLVFLLRTPGTILLYVFFTIFLASRSVENKQIFSQNLRNVHTYWKSAIMGFVQLAAPYLLFMYGLKVLSPTVGGVCMAAAPWMTTILERFPCVKHKSAITPLKILAMCIGFAGVIIVAVSDVFLALNSNGDCHFQVSTTNLTSGLNNSAANQSYSPKYIPLSKKVCTKYTTVQVSTSLIALLGGSFMWSISSVFWRSKRGDIHYVMAGIWNNAFAGLYALAFWFGLRHYENNLHQVGTVQWHDYKGILSIIFLTVLSGWIAAIIVNYMYKNVEICEEVGVVFESIEKAANMHIERDNPFHDGYREVDDGGTSEEEIDTGRHQPISPFPPLVEVKPTTDD